MSDVHPFIEVLRYLRAEFQRTYPGYTVRTREPGSTELDILRTIWIAAPDLQTDQEDRNSAPEVPLTFPVVVNVVYAPSFNDGQPFVPPVEGMDVGEAHYEKVLLARIKEQRVFERVGAFATSLNIRGFSDGSTQIITEKRVISASVFAISFQEPAGNEGE